MKKTVQLMRGSNPYRAQHQSALPSINLFLVFPIQIPTEICKTSGPGLWSPDDEFIFSLLTSFCWEYRLHVSVYSDCYIN